MRTPARHLGVSSRDAGLAIVANLANCDHDVIPVESGGEVVAALCSRCLRELPLGWLA